MNTINPKVDSYLVDGCGRCSYYQTPQCKVNTWRKLLVQLRRIVMDCELTEEYKWSQPCYTYNGNNVVIVTAFKEYAALSFFKGSLLKDPESILVAPGKNSQSARQIRFTELEEITDKEPIIKDYVLKAIAIEKAGRKVTFKKNPEPLPDELVETFEKDEDLKVAFEALTPGRKRGYIIHFSQPKQSKTRMSRIEKCRDKILKGEGMHDAYRASIKK